MMVNDYLNFLRWIVGFGKSVFCPDNIVTEQVAATFGSKQRLRAPDHLTPSSKTRIACERSPNSRVN